MESSSFTQMEEKTLNYFVEEAKSKIKDDGCLYKHEFGVLLNKAPDDIKCFIREKYYPRPIRTFLEKHSEVFLEQGDDSIVVRSRTFVRDYLNRLKNDHENENVESYYEEDYNAIDVDVSYSAEMEDKSLNYFVDEAKNVIKDEGHVYKSAFGDFLKTAPDDIRCFIYENYSPRPIRTFLEKHSDVFLENDNFQGEKIVTVRSRKFIRHYLHQMKKENENQYAESDYKLGPQTSGTQYQRTASSATPISFPICSPFIAPILNHEPHTKSGNSNSIEFKSTSITKEAIIKQNISSSNSCAMFHPSENDVLKLPLVFEASHKETPKVSTWKDLLGFQDSNETKSYLGNNLATNLVKDIDKIETQSNRSNPIVTTQQEMFKNSTSPESVFNRESDSVYQTLFCEAEKCFDEELHFFKELIRHYDDVTDNACHTFSQTESSGEILSRFFYQNE